MISSISNFVSSIPNMTSHVSDNTISKIAITLVAMLGSSFITVTHAGPILATACYTSCLTAGALLGPGAAIYIPICLQGCPIAMAIPSI